MLLTQLVEVSCHGSEFIVVVDEENAVQFSRFSARSVLVGNQSSAAQHTLHQNRRSTQSKINLSDDAQYRRGTLVLFQESRWVIFKVQHTMTDSDQFHWMSVCTTEKLHKSARPPKFDYTFLFINYTAFG